MTQLYTTRQKEMRIFLTIAAMLFFQSCNYNTNISKEPGFARIVGREVITRRSLNLYPIDYQNNSYRDRHELGTYLQGVPLIGIIPTGHHVFIERAVRRGGYNQIGLQYLEGHLMYNQKAYPVAYCVGSQSDNCTRSIDDSFAILKGARLHPNASQKSEQVVSPNGS